MRLAEIVSTEIVPRFALLQVASVAPDAAVVTLSTLEEIAEFAALVLKGNPEQAQRHLVRMKAQRMSIETLFSGAARANSAPS